MADPIEPMEKTGVFPDATPANAHKRKYLVSRNRDKFIIELPAKYKVTFGYVNPSASGQGYRQGQGHCLRVWEGKALRAVFSDITGFRDLSIPYAVKIEKETGTAKWERDSMGNFEESTSVSVDHHLEQSDDDIDFED